jgi:hypothetical protein
MLLKLYLKSNPSETIVVSEHSDWLFAEGWRFLEEVPYHDMFDVSETKRQLAIQQYGY